jgi:hypothetical protein
MFKLRQIEQDILANGRVEIQELEVLRRGGSWTRSNIIQTY